MASRNIFRFCFHFEILFMDTLILFCHIEFDTVVVEPLNLKVNLHNELPGFQ